METKVYTPEEIKDKILTNQKWLERAILAIFERQTFTEQEEQITRFKNGVGFSAAHAHVMSYCANWLIRGNHLSGKWVDKSQSVMIHYTKQLAAIANGEE